MALPSAWDGFYKTERNRREPLSPPFELAIAQSRKELHNAGACLSSYKLLYWNERTVVCEAPSLEETKQLLRAYEPILFVRSYGESEYFMQETDAVVRRAAQFKKVSTPSEFRALERNGDRTLKDIWFFVQFLDWYLCKHEKKQPNVDCGAGDDKPVDDTTFGPSWEEMPSTAIGADDFHTYLATLD